MRVLLTGANGYIGKRLFPVLLEAGHHVVALTRMGTLDVPPRYAEQVSLVTGDLGEPATAEQISSIDAAYYLVHSMSDLDKDFAAKEERVAHAFNTLVVAKGAKQVIYLSGLIGEEDLSRHLASRLQVEKILGSSGIPLTVFRAGIIIGTGSASFEIMRDLVEMLPIMVAPRWLSNECQPISIHDVSYYLLHALGEERCKNHTFDIGGPDILTFKQMLEQLAQIRGLRRKIFVVPVLTPRLSSYWLFFVTSTNFALARLLVESMRHKSVCHEHSIEAILPRQCLNYRAAVEIALSRVAEPIVLSSWKDNWVLGDQQSSNFNDYLKVPEHGCLQNIQRIPCKGNIDAVVDKIWAIGGNNGWYYGDWLWDIRGILDKLSGGVGLRRGRTDPHHLTPGDALDFWRVIVADRAAKRLLLYAEMKVPGEAWLEFRVIPMEGGYMELVQTATFRPHGLYGRLYWYTLVPFHYFIFRGMARAIAKAADQAAEPTSTLKSK